MMMIRLVALTALLALLAGCAHAPTPTLRFERPVVLLGEVHDNAAQHALRLQAFEASLAGGARPALVMEQFDRERQGVIDRLRAQTPPPDADALIAAAGAPSAGAGGWQWRFYRPFVALALQHGLPIVAANVSRDEARRVMREGLQATVSTPPCRPSCCRPWPTTSRTATAACSTTAAARRMALAQVARDQAMAAAVEKHAERGVVLLAGNGHVRIDAGVPRWLTPATRARSEAIGLLESDHPGGGQYDRVVLTATQERPDPCAGMRR